MLGNFLKQVIRSACYPDAHPTLDRRTLEASSSAICMRETGAVKESIHAKLTLTPNRNGTCDLNLHMECSQTHLFDNDVIMGGKDSFPLGRWPLALHHKMSGVHVALLFARQITTHEDAHVRLHAAAAFVAKLTSVYGESPTENQPTAHGRLLRDAGAAIREKDTGNKLIAIGESCATDPQFERERSHLQTALATAHANCPARKRMRDEAEYLCTVYRLL